MTELEKIPSYSQQFTKKYKPLGIYDLAALACLVH